MQKSIEYLNKLDKLEELVQKREQLELQKGEDVKNLSKLEEHIRIVLTEIRNLELKIMDVI